MVEISRVDFEVVRPLRDSYRAEADCQIVRDSILPRGMADAYLIHVGGSVAGYGAVWNKHFVGRIMEFHALPDRRHDVHSMFSALVTASGASHLEAQTNVPAVASIFNEWTHSPEVEHLLFEDTRVTDLPAPGGQFRARLPTDQGPDGEWVVELDDRVVCAGGILHHYNPPYGDLYMETVPEERRHGFGSYLVQELKAKCRELGKTPAARCNPTNQASLLTLERAGLSVCGELLAGPLLPNRRGST